MKKTAIAILVLAASLARAAAGSEASHGGGHEVAIPLTQIGWQAANLGILLIGIFFLIKKSMVDAFANRRKEYLERSEKTKAALVEAEQALAEVKQKLSGLESGEGAAIETARKEAEALKAQIITDAAGIAEKIKKDAQLTIANELAKAKEAINQTILNQALAEASKSLEQNKMQTANQETSFIKQIERV